MYFSPITSLFTVNILAAHLKSVPILYGTNDIISITKLFGRLLGRKR